MKRIAPTHRGTTATEPNMSRVMGHLRAIAAVPRPAGSVANEQCRNYIAEQLSRLGVEYRIVSGLAKVDLGKAPYGGTYRAGGLSHCIVARLARNTGEPALETRMFLCHFDSVEQGAGASDSGVAVSAMIEAVATLAGSAERHRDLLFVFTDAEEAGLLGATQLFSSAECAALFADVDSVFNFEARGTSGPITIFETGTDSVGLIHQALTVDNRVKVSSVFDFFYDQAPNTTDFSLAKNMGWRGLNFAFIGSFDRYHSPADNLEHVQSDLVRRYWRLMVELGVRAREDEDLRHLGERRQFFTLFGCALVALPNRISWLPIAAAGACAAIQARHANKQDGRYSASSTTARQLLRFTANVLLSASASKILSVRRPSYRRLGALPSAGPLHVVYAAGALALATTQDEGPDVARRSANAHLLLSVIGALSAKAAPTSTFLFSVPVLSTSATKAVGQVLRLPTGMVELIARGAEFSLLLPVVRMMYVGLGQRNAFASNALLAISLESAATLLVQLSPDQRSLLRRLSLGVALTAGLGYVGLGLYRADPEEGTTLSLLYDYDTKTRVYFSSDRVCSPSVRHALGPHARTGELRQYFPTWQRRLHYSIDADSIDPAAAPSLDVRSSERVGPGVRRVRMHLASMREAPTIGVALSSPVFDYQLGEPAEDEQCPAAATVNGGNWELWLYAIPPAGIDLTVVICAEPVSGRILDRTHGIAVAFGGPAPIRRPENYAAAVDLESWGNGTFGTRKFTI